MNAKEALTISLRIRLAQQDTKATYLFSDALKSIREAAFAGQFDVTVPVPDGLAPQDRAIVGDMLRLDGFKVNVEEDAITVCWDALEIT